eukprot:gb/GECG01016275.1/.p1 GENE.gb/GECG01016275.1/~~gb/GECG01016275.1/.p1  ORF type:complete len:502 (+),score=87.99 gb/GECG01016275.1/:1-1506(+)
MDELFDAVGGKPNNRRNNNRNTTTASPARAVPPPSDQPARRGLRGSQGKNESSSEKEENHGGGSSPKAVVDAPAPKKSSSSHDALAYAAVGAGVALIGGVASFFASGGRQKKGKKGNGKGKGKDKKQNTSKSQPSKTNDQNERTATSSETDHPSARETLEEGTSTPCETEEVIREADPQAKGSPHVSSEGSCEDVEGLGTSAGSPHDRDAASENNGTEILSSEQPHNQPDSVSETSPMQTGTSYAPRESTAEAVFDTAQENSCPLNSLFPDEHDGDTVSGSEQEEQTAGCSSTEQRISQSIHPSTASAPSIRTETGKANSEHTALSDNNYVQTTDDSVSVGGYPSYAAKEETSTSITNPSNMAPTEAGRNVEYRENDSLRKEQQGTGEVFEETGFHQEESLPSDASDSNNDAIPRLRNVKYQKPLDGGNFSTVWKGLFNDDTSVAIKFRVTEDSTDATGLGVSEEVRSASLKSILREAEIMARACEHRKFCLWLSDLQSLV